MNFALSSRSDYFYGHIRNVESFQTSSGKNTRGLVYDDASFAGDNFRSGFA